ncbi:MAG: GNAT family N-acetyltransferase [Burkholderiales bacterium]
MTVLVPLPPEGFAAFVEDANAGYARDNVVAGRWTSDEAPVRARAEFEQLLPQGLATPGHHVYEIRDEASDDAVGHLWFTLEGAGEARSAYVYSILVKSPFRRRGHATAALSWLEQFAAARGATGIRLNVFAHNPNAQALYRALGYAVTAMTMRKSLQAD